MTRPQAEFVAAGAIVKRPYETLFRHVLYPLYESVLLRRGTLRFLAEYERTQWLSADAIAALQWKKLKALVDHCWREVPYYRRCWTALGVTPDDIRSPEDYARLPLLTKADIRTHFADLVAPSHRNRLLTKATGGSTGEPLRFGYTRESHERRVAVMWRGYGWAGARMGRRTSISGAGRSASRVARRHSRTGSSMRHSHATCSIRSR